MLCVLSRRAGMGVRWYGHVLQNCHGRTGTVVMCRRVSVASHRGCRCAENMSALDRYGTEKCEVGWVTLFGVVRYRRAMSGDVGLGLRGSEGVGMSSEMEGLTVIIC